MICSGAKLGRKMAERTTALNRRRMPKPPVIFLFVEVIA
jgi:hypothetical protein